MEKKVKKYAVTEKSWGIHGTAVSDGNTVTVTYNISPEIMDKSEFERRFEIEGEIEN